jgi:hypothetical protein
VNSSADPSVFGQPVTFTTTVVATPPGVGTPTGSVTFDVDGNVQTPILLNGIGQASITLTNLGVGSHTVAVTYGGDANFVSSSTTTPLTQLVGSASTSTAIAASVGTALIGQLVTYTATVTEVSPSSATPTGTVTFMVDGNAQSPTNLDGTGKAAFTTSFASSGPHTVAVNYGGNTQFSASSASTNETVNPSTTTTSLLTSANPSVFGQTVTFTATVATNAPGNGTASGLVTFSIDSVTQTPVALNSSGQATFSISSLALGSHSITASYSGTTNFTASSTAAALSQVVGQAGSTTVVTSSLNPSAFGQPVTFTAHVNAAAPASGTPTGSVTFFVDGSSQSTVAVDASGNASVTLSSLSGGTHSITATYGGDSNYGASAATALSQTVSQAGSNTVLASSVNPSLFGQSVSFTATVTPTFVGGGTPTGTVTFLVDGSNQTQATVNAAGHAILTLSSLTRGQHTITATYSGDSSFATSTASPLTQTVFNNSTTTTLATSASTAVFGQAITLTAVVAATPPSTSLPTGTVTFIVDGVARATVAVNGFGRALLTLSNLAVGAHTITADYSGDANLSASNTASVLKETVSKSGTTTKVTSSASPSASGQSVTFTATIAAIAPGAGVPTGTVTFVIDGVSEKPVTVNSAGKAAFAISTLKPGTHTITASYNGSTNFNASHTATALSQTVQSPASKLTAKLIAPKGVSTNTAFSISVTAANSSGATVTGFVGPVTLSLISEPSGGALSGTLTGKITTGGTFQFNNLKVNKSGKYVVRVVSGSLVTTLTINTVGRQT